MILLSVLQAIGLFLATNVDDIIVLSLFFARGAGQRGSTVRILVGQYLGFVGILAAAVLVSLGAGAFLPPEVIPYIGVYVPVFLSVGPAAVVAYCVVFLALVAVLVVVAKFIATRRPIAEILERWEHILFPLVLIGLGIFILISGGAFGL